MTENSPGQAATSRDVFLSYASPDKVAADAVCEALELAGVACWIAPRDVTPGEFYADAIVRALNESRILVLVLTDNALTSPHVLRELERTSAKRHPIVSIRLTTSPLPPALEYFLSASHWLDATATGLKPGLPMVVGAARHLVLPVPGSGPTHADDPTKSAAGFVPHSIAARIRAALSRPPVMVMAVAGLVVVYLLVVKLWNLQLLARTRPAAMAAVVTAPTNMASTAIPDKSVAVLPFVDMSEKKDQEYFSDGLSEELIDRLAHAVDLKVIARTSSFQFKGKNDDMRTIGRRLGVANLLEGSVRTSGNTIRVTAQLIRVVDGAHRWSETYDRKRGDIFKVQDEIAGAVVAALKTTMRAPPSSSREQSANIDSYNEVLRGRYFDRRGTKEDSARALSAFERAIKLDPTNAEAWVGLAAAYYVRGAMSWTPPLEAYAEARKALDRALTINPDLASAHAYLGALEWYYNRDFTAAEREFNRSFELDPSQAADPMYEGVLAAAAGRTDEALAAFRRARDINPLDINTLLTLASTLDDTDLPGAERLYRQILEINPDVAAAYCNLGQIRLAQHQPEAALALMSKEPDEGIRMTCMPDALWDLGRHQEADAMLAQVESKFADSMALALATCYARRNEKDTAFKWLSRAYDNHEPMITMIKSIPELHILHSDPRFSNLLQKLNLPR